jgi:hypothetical protein
MEQSAGIRGKISRARAHLLDLEVEVGKFLATNPFPLATKRNPDTQQLVYYVASVRDPPTAIALIAGDLVQNLRGALDHLAHRLVVVGRGDPGPFAYVYFPIGTTQENYEARKARYTAGMTVDTLKALDDLRPYKGGNDPLWRLNELSIIDKHRLLIAVGARVRSIDLGYYMTEMMAKNAPAWAKNAPALAAFFRLADMECPIREGEEVFIDQPGAEPLGNLPVRFHVALCEPDVLGKGSDSIVETLRPIVEAVEDVFSAMKPFLG